MHQAFDTFEPGIGWDAMAEVKNVSGPSAHLLQQSAGFGGDYLRRGSEEKGIQVTLHSDCRWQLGGGLSQRDVPVHSHHLGASFRQVAPVRVSAFREND